MQMYGVIRAAFDILKATIAKDRAGNADKFCGKYRMAGLWKNEESGFLYEKFLSNDRIHEHSWRRQVG